MSADGEVEVAVRAEGVDEAAGEMGGDTLAQTDAPAAAAGPGGGGGRGGGGRFGKLLTRIAGLLAFLGPILKVVQVVSEVLEAFVAPLAIILLRILQPVLRLLLKALPFVFDIADRILGVIDWLGKISQGLINTVVNTIIKVRDKVAEVVTKLVNLPGKIADAISDFGEQTVEAAGQAGVAGLRSGRLEGGERSAAVVSALAGGASLEEIKQALREGQQNQQRDRGDTNVILQGGLGAFVERGEKDPNVNLFGQ